MTKKLKLFTLAFFIVLIGFQYWVTLNEQKTPPSPEWSRSIQTDGLLDDYVDFQSLPTENGYSISLKTFDQLHNLDCTKTFECVRFWSFGDLNTRKSIWSDGDATYFIDGDSLIRSSTSPSSGNNLIIAKNVENFAKSDDTLVYWQTNQKLIVEQDGKEAFTLTVEQPVYATHIVNDHIYVISYDVSTYLYTVFEVTNDLQQLFQFTTNPSEIIHSFNLFSLQDERVGMLIESEIISGGNRKKSVRTAFFNTASPETPSFSTLAFIDKETGNKLSDIRFPSVFTGISGTYMTFSASMFDSTGTKVNQVFVGDYDDAMIEASAVTKTGNYFIRPHMINDNTVAYFKTNGKQQELMFSSSSSEYRVLSAKGLNGDAKEALYTFITLLFNGLLLVLLSFTWIILSFLVSYGSLALMRKWYQKNVFIKTYFIQVGALLLLQLWLFSKIFNSESMVSRAPYLTEVWHVWVVVFVSAIGCILPVVLSRTKITEDNSLLMILYATALNLMILFFLLGPYFI